MATSTTKDAPPSSLTAQASQLYRSGENKELEKLFAKFLKKSFDVDFWNLYIEYVKKVSTKKVSLADVYAFAFGHFEGSYVAAEFARPYITELELTGEDSTQIELIRKVYHRSLVPTHGLAQLWNDYEKWESRVSRHGAKAHIDHAHHAFTLASNAYHRLAPHIDANRFFSIFDIELENPLRLQPKELDQRLEFLFNYYLARFPGSAVLSFLFSFYLKDAAKDKLDFRTESVFLKIWYSFQYNMMSFDLEDKSNRDLITINYLNWISKTEGVEAQRRKFTEIKDRAGPHVFIYMAHIELTLNRNKKEAYQTFTEGVERFRGDPMLNEQFLEAFIRAGDDDSVRLLFKILKKTERMWDLMLAYEFQYGELEEYRRLLIQRQTDQMLPPAPLIQGRKKSPGSQGIYESVVQSFEYLDLKMKYNDILSEFIAKLPVLSAAENVLSNVDNYKIVEMIASLSSR